jgi:hypothetical protein
MHPLGTNLNLLLGWLWLWLAFISGLVMGCFFHREDWLGGYASFKRRLYRLAHISFFGLGIINLCFWFTVRSLPPSSNLRAASWLMATGALSMPVCCVLMAHRPVARWLFSIPILCLLAGGGLTMALLPQVLIGKF